MAFEKDFFSINAGPMDVNGPSQNGCCPGFPDFFPFPGCGPGPNSQWFPYGPSSSYSSTTMAFYMPWPITISQLIIVNFPNSQYGGGSGSVGSTARLIVGGLIKGTHIWSAAERANDSGHVWDLNVFIPSQTPIQVQGNNYRTCNTATINEFQVFLTGYHLREY